LSVFYERCDLGTSCSLVDKCRDVNLVVRIL